MALQMRALARFASKDIAVKLFYRPLPLAAAVGKAKWMHEKAPNLVPDSAAEAGALEGAASAPKRLVLFSLLPPLADMDQLS